MLASVDRDEAPAVQMNVGDPAGVSVPACPVVDRRGQSEHPGVGGVKLFYLDPDAPVKQADFLKIPNEVFTV